MLAALSGTFPHAAHKIKQSFGNSVIIPNGIYD